VQEGVQIQAVAMLQQLTRLNMQQASAVAKAPLCYTERHDESAACIFIYSPSKVCTLREALALQAFPWNTQLQPWERAQPSQSGRCDEDDACCSMCAQPLPAEDRYLTGVCFA